MDLDTLYISTGSDITSYFCLAANRINVFILGHVLMALFINGSTDSQTVYSLVLKTANQALPFALCNM